MQNSNSKATTFTLFTHLGLHNQLSQLKISPSFSLYIPIWIWILLNNHSI